MGAKVGPAGTELPHHQTTISMIQLTLTLNHLQHVAQFSLLTGQAGARLGELVGHEGIEPCGRQAARAVIRFADAK